MIFTINEKDNFNTLEELFDHIEKNGLYTDDLVLDIKYVSNKKKVISYRHSNDIKQIVLRMCLNKQLSLHNEFVSSIKDKNIENWYMQYEMTPDEAKEWETYCINLIRKLLKVTKKMALEIFKYSINFPYGLKIKTT